MSTAELTRTTAFRLAIMFSSLFGVLAAGVFVLVYYLSAAFVEAQTAQRLQRELDALLEVHHEGGLDGLVESLSERSSVAGLANLYYLLENAEGEFVAGNLQRWPANIEPHSASGRFRRAVALPAAGVLDWDHDETYEVVARTAKFPGGHRLLVGIGLY